MPSTYKTKHGLNQWVETDIPDMLDFNDDNELIDSFMSHAINNQPFAVEPADWTETDLISYPYAATVAVPGMTENDDALLLFALRSVLTARMAGVTDGLGETVEGGVRILAVHRPTAAVRGHCSTIHREAIV